MKYTLKSIVTRGLYILTLSLFLASAYLPQQVSAADTPTECPYGFYSDNDIQAYDRCAKKVEVCNVAVSAGGAATVPKDFNLGSTPAERHVSLIKALMTDYGLTAQQAAGIVGNFMHEAGGNRSIPPDFNQDDKVGAPPKFRGGYGWAQWTGGRQTSFIKYAVDNGYMASKSVSATDAANYAYLKYELASRSYTNTIPELKKQSTPEDAAISFEATFERAGIPALKERKDNAVTAFQEYSSASGGTTESGCAPAAGDAGVVGDIAFPLLGGKSVVKSPGMFANNTTSLSGHPYTAYDIMANPGVPIVSFMSGVVTSVTSDKCGGRMISVYNAASDRVISYLHMNLVDNAAKGQLIATGQRIGTVGSNANGCGSAHLHIDAAKGKSRPGCKRESCSAANKALFVDIGPQLYQTFQALPN